MILTNNPKFKKKIFDYKNLCFGEKNRFNHYDIGWNYRYTNLQAALGINQLKRIKKIIKKKKDIGKYYYENLKNLPNIYIQKPYLNSGTFVNSLNMSQRGLWLPSSFNLKTRLQK